MKIIVFTTKKIIFPSYPFRFWSRSLHFWRRDVWMDQSRGRRWLWLDPRSGIGQLFHGSSKGLLQLFSRVSNGWICVHRCRISPKTWRSSLPFLSFLWTDRYEYYSSNFIVSQNLCQRMEKVLEISLERKERMWQKNPIDIRKKWKDDSQSPSTFDRRKETC